MFDSLARKKFRQKKRCFERMILHNPLTKSILINKWINKCQLSTFESTNLRWISYSHRTTCAPQFQKYFVLYSCEVRRIFNKWPIIVFVTSVCYTLHWRLQRLRKANKTVKRCDSVKTKLFQHKTKAKILDKLFGFFIA